LTSGEFTQTLKDHDIKISMDGKNVIRPMLSSFRWSALFIPLRGVHLALFRSMRRNRDLLMSACAKSGLAFALIAGLLAGCTEHDTTQMVIRPKLSASESGGASQRRVVLFRAVVDENGTPMEEPWALHISGLRLFAIVAPKGAQLSSWRGVLPGRPDSLSSDAGWGFVALPPGEYQLAFEGMAIRFAMAGADYVSAEAVPIGRSPPSAFVVPADANLIYIGTFSFTCHEPSSRPDALKLECTSLEISNEAQLARKIGESSLSKYGPLQEALASAPNSSPSR